MLVTVVEAVALAILAAAGTFAFGSSRWTVRAGRACLPDTSIVRPALAHFTMTYCQPRSAAFEATILDLAARGFIGARSDDDGIWLTYTEPGSLVPALSGWDGVSGPADARRFRTRCEIQAGASEAHGRSRVLGIAFGRASRRARGISDHAGPAGGRGCGRRTGDRIRFGGAAAAAGRPRRERAVVEPIVHVHVEFGWCWSGVFAGVISP